MRKNFQNGPNTGFPDIDESVFSGTAQHKIDNVNFKYFIFLVNACLLYTSPSPRD